MPTGVAEKRSYDFSVGQAFRTRIQEDIQNGTHVDQRLVSLEYLNQKRFYPKHFRSILPFFSKRNNSTATPITQPPHVRFFFSTCFAFEWPFCIIYIFVVDRFNYFFCRVRARHAAFERASVKCPQPGLSVADNGSCARGIVKQSTLSKNTSTLIGVHLRIVNENIAHARVQQEHLVSHNITLNYDLITVAASNTIKSTNQIIQDFARDVLKKCCF